MDPPPMTMCRKPPHPETGGRRPLLRCLPFAILVAALVLALAGGLHHQLTLDALARHHDRITGLIEAHPLVAIAGFGLIYAVSVAISLPGAALLSLAAGLFFGVPLGLAIVLVAATAGAVAVFLAARGALRPLMLRHAGAKLCRMEAGFRRNAVSYLLFLRLMPVFPFFVVNVAPALFGMRLLSYAAVTLIGIVPGALVFVSLGAGLGGVVAEGRVPELGDLMTVEIMAGLSGLAVLALLPALVSHVKARRAARRRP
jgi:uncharacterized membrane protein YdjX (TVP38/TMEM64 family)